MAIASDVPSYKYGAASDIKFGCPTFGERFTIVESVSATSTYQTNIALKNEVGITVGQVVGDPKVEMTISGVHEKAPVTLGEIESIALFVFGAKGGPSGSEGTTDNDCLVTSVKQDNSNEDFMKFEIQAEFYENIDLGSEQAIKESSDEF